MARLQRLIRVTTGRTQGPAALLESPQQIHLPEKNLKSNPQSRLSVKPAVAPRRLHMETSTSTGASRLKGMLCLRWATSGFSAAIWGLALLCAVGMTLSRRRDAQDWQIAESPAQIVILCEANETVAALSRQPPADAAGDVSGDVPQPQSQRENAPLTNTWSCVATRRAQQCSWQRAPIRVIICTFLSTT